MILCKLTLGNQLIIPWQVCQFPWKQGFRIDLRREGGFPVGLRGTAATFHSYYWFGTTLGCYALQDIKCGFLWFWGSRRFYVLLSSLPSVSSCLLPGSELTPLDHMWIQFGCCSCGALDRKHLLELLKGSSKHWAWHAVFEVLGFRKGKVSASVVFCSHSHQQVKQ